MGGTKRDFALIRHGHTLGELDDLDLSGVVDNSLIQYDAASGDWQDITLASLNGQLDHGTLAGLADDDHPQYAAIAQAETITETWTWTDNDEIRLGTGGDLRLYHDGTNSIIRNDTGELRLQGGANIGLTIASTGDLSSAQTATWTGVHTFTNINGFTVSSGNPRWFLDESDQADDERFWSFAVNAKVFGIRARNDAATAARDILLAARGSGIAISSISFGNSTDNPPFTFSGTGAVKLGSDNQELQIGASQDLRLYHDGTDSWIDNNTGVCWLDGADNGYYFRGPAGTVREFGFTSGALQRWLFRCTNTAEIGSNAGSDFQWISRTDAGSLNMVVLSIRRDNGNLLMENDNQELKLGAGQDLRLLHDGTDSIVRTDTGGLRLQFSTNNRFEVNTTGVGFNGATPIARPDYTITNPTTNRSIDVSTITHADLAQVVGTMIQDLINYGLYQ